ncbi:mitochondrial inner membrane protease subunit 1 isoform X2 [Heterocephalus glaber]|nr:mitochondrial inner membrane protease subunit 1 isoform X2 [Heterocephalus glaber]XP_021119632.1 mitochondrial inner membrane protease subunit 1 isoform X2 [Heterocephalus glaber]XP_021119633.1 mitochondrial inner membrane protease subunit 1 isoform X2 [Heterocephalus glaber]
MCSGPSMEPTIQNSDIVFAENLSRHFHGIQRTYEACGDSEHCECGPSLPSAMTRKTSGSGTLCLGPWGPGCGAAHTSCGQCGADAGCAVVHRARHRELRRPSTAAFPSPGRHGSSRLEDSPGQRLERVPTGHVWLEGDNLQNSTDSRFYGPIPYGLIRGRIFFKIWPLSDFGFLRDSPNGHRFSDN